MCFSFFMRVDLGKGVSSPEDSGPAVAVSPGGRGLACGVEGVKGLRTEEELEGGGLLRAAAPLALGVVENDPRSAVRVIVVIINRALDRTLPER